MKTGVNTGTIIDVKNSPIIKKADEKSKKRKKRANICVKCTCNDNGFCLEYKAWTGRVNYKCLGIEDPYKKNKKEVKLDKKTRKKLENITPKQIESLAKRYKIK